MDISRDYTREFRAQIDKTGLNLETQTDPPIAFLGLNEDKIEMLFALPASLEKASNESSRHLPLRNIELVLSRLMNKIHNRQAFIDTSDLTFLSGQSLTNKGIFTQS